MSKTPTRKSKLEAAVAREFARATSKITRFSTKEIEAKDNELCVFSKKLGLFVCYVPNKVANEEE